MKSYKKIGVVFAVLSVVMISGFVVHSVLAAGTLTSAYDRLNRVQTAVTTGVVHNIVFTPATTVTGGSGFSILMLQFPVSDPARWCRTVGAGTAAVDTENGTATGLPGTTLSSSCTQGNGTTSNDTLLVCATGGSPTWTGGQIYGVTAQGSTDVLGTSATTSNNIVVNLSTGTSTTCTSTFTAIDTGSIALATLSSDQVSVTATVPPLLSFSISSSSVGFGTLTANNVYYANTGSSASISEPSAANTTGVTISTNAPSGLIISALDSGGGGTSGLYKSATPSHLVTSTNANAVTAGNEGFGLYVYNLGGLTAGAGFGSGKGSATTAISTSAQTILTSAAAISNGSSSVALVAAISNITPAGAYSDSITLTGTGKF